MVLLDGLIGIDHPLAVWRPDVGTVALFTDWRGVYVLGSISNGAACCSGFLWPARAMTVGRLTPPQSGLVLWLGSVLQEGRDQSTLQYKRNRYYDPTSGRFTQSDPIGLAGGLNAYGFAGGDPVSYSDPFGLCPPKTPAEVLMCTGQLLEPAQGPLEAAGTLAVTPLAGGMGMLGEAATTLGAASRTSTAATTRVLGHYPEYLEVGQKLGAKVFSIPGKIWSAMSEEEQWKPVSGLAPCASSGNCSVSLYDALI